ncbi:MAG: hypothetical protein F6K19_37765 [Cyanothece sp. SIO1E1]|nr:hypothetical protein [Cyanothece sp. SIO1E1]
MQFKLHILLFLAVSLGIAGCQVLKSAFPSNQSETFSKSKIAVQSNTFFCGRNDNGAPTLMARSDWGNIPVISFETDYFSESGWSSERRCKQISSKVQNFEKRGLLKHLTTETVNGEQVVCISKQMRRHLNLPPGDVGLLMTLRQDDNPYEVIDALSQTSSLSSGGLVH